MKLIITSNKEVVMNTANTSSATLEQRLRAVEDRLEIYNLIASHPPSADTGADYFVRAVYEPDGVLDLGGDKKAAGNEAIAAIVKTPAHQAAIGGAIVLFPAFSLFPVLR